MPNQNTSSKFLIREELGLQFPQSLSHSRLPPSVPKWNGTRPPIPPNHFVSIQLHDYSRSGASKTRIPILEPGTQPRLPASAMPNSSFPSVPVPSFLASRTIPLCTLPHPSSVPEAELRSSSAPHPRSRLRPDRRRLRAGLLRQHPRPHQRHHRAGCPRLAAQLRPRLGHGRVRHAAPLHRHPHPARERARQDRRPHPRDSAPHRPQPALRRRHAGPRRAHRHPRLRRHPGRRRHAHRRHHRRRRRPGPRPQRAGRRRHAQEVAAQATGRRHLGRHRRRQRRCSTSATKKTRRPKST